MKNLRYVNLYIVYNLLNDILLTCDIRAESSNANSLFIGNLPLEISEDTWYAKSSRSLSPSPGIFLRQNMRDL